MGSPAAWKRLTLLPLALAGHVLFGCAGEPQPPPSFLLLSVDTLSRSALRPYSEQARTLPSLDAFAAESVRFDAANSSASWTLPAHGSLLTGLYPDRHGATDRRVSLAPEAPRLAELLRGRGYETAAFIGGGYLRARYGFDVGFESYDESVRDEKTGGHASAPDGTPGVAPEQEPIDRARAYLEARLPTDPPFFLFVHTFSVHGYFRANPWSVRVLPEFDDLTGQGYLSCLQGHLRCPPRIFRRLERLYRAELGHFDRAFGRLLGSLYDAGLSEQTVVVLLSDHGEAFEVDRGRIHHGGRLHADQLEIPLLLRIPGEAPRSVSEPVSIVDLMPTLLEMAGVDPPADLDGRSLLPLLRGEPAPPRTLFGMEHYHAWPGGERRESEAILPRPLALAVIRDGAWYLRGPEGEELYDTRADPRQAHDRLAAGAAPPDALAALRAEADARLRDRPQTPLVEETPELREELRALGYLE